MALDILAGRGHHLIEFHLYLKIGIALVRPRASLEDQFTPAADAGLGTHRFILQDATILTAHQASHVILLAWSCLAIIARMSKGRDARHRAVAHEAHVHDRARYAQMAPGPQSRGLRELGPRVVRDRRLARFPLATITLHLSR